MKKIKTAYPFCFGTLIIEYEDDVLYGLSCGTESYEIYKEEALSKSSFSDLVMKQVNEFLYGNRDFFEIKYDFKGTDFQKKVWNALLAIPYGETRTYKQIAEQIGNSKACRAVGMANNKNPLLLVIPCHRVIGADGSLTGYAGGLQMKQYLLNLEKIRQKEYKKCNIE